MRVQSINAGHTVRYAGHTFKMRTIPCAFVCPTTVLLLGPGCFIDEGILQDEIRCLEDAGFKIRPRLKVDYRAWMIQPMDYETEKQDGIKEKIGSTGEAAGSSLIRKMRRLTNTAVGANRMPFERVGIEVTDTVRLCQNKSVLLEGCQGTMLGLHTSPYYPYVTSRECSASAILGEAGFAPADVQAVWGIFRTYPIRVGGNSGPTGGKEISWAHIAQASGAPVEPERTTVTNRERRIFELSIPDLKHALMINKPNRLALTFLDYINASDRGRRSWAALSERSKTWIWEVERQIGRTIDWFSTGPEPEDAFMTYTIMGGRLC
jgi:adenylosuccinate synthase